MIDAKLLSKVAIFEGLEPERLAHVAKICEEVHFAQNEVLTQEGAEANSFYILLDGHVRISKKLHLPSMEDREGEDRILTVVSGETLPALGETALLGGSQRIASMHCVSPCTLLRIHAATLLALMDSDHSIARIIYGNLCAILYKRLESANTDVVKLSAALVYALEA